MGEEVALLDTRVECCRWRRQLQRVLIVRASTSARKTLRPWEGANSGKHIHSASLPSRLDNKPRLRVSDIGSRPTLAVCPTQHLPYGEGDSFVRLYTARNTAWERNCGTALELQDGSKFKRERYN